MSDLERKIVANMMYNSEFAGKVVPYTKGEYFEDYGEIAEEICKFYNKYGQSPTKSELKIEIRARKGLTDKAVNTLTDRIDGIPVDDKSDFNWLMEKTEKFYQTRAMANAVINGAELIDRGEEQSGQILKMVEDALAVSFDNHIGLDYFEDVERRYEMYHTVEDKVSWGVPSLDRITVGGMSKKTATCCVASTGCHAKGTKIVMSDGSFKNVEDIKVGERLMGYNGQYRTVLRLARGHEKMYRISPRRAESFVVNENHILPLFNVVTKEIDNITVKDYINKSKHWKHIHYIVTNDKELEFENPFEPTIEPYFFGVWLGDGHSRNMRITNCNPTIGQCLKEFSERCDDINYWVEVESETRVCHHFPMVTRSKHNTLIDEFAKYGINIGQSKKNAIRCEGKFIPKEYQRMSVENRYQLLAGILDTDGWIEDSRYGFCSKSERLADDVVRLAGGLGHGTSKRTKIVGGVPYYVIGIMGLNLSKIPCKVKPFICETNPNKDVHHMSFMVEELPEDDFYGFALDGDHLYYMENWTLQHNTGKSAIMCAIAANVIRQGKNVLYISMEMSEDRVAERIDANLMNETVYNVRNMNYKSYIASTNKLKEKAYGRLIIREFPTSAAGVTQFKVLLKDLKTKKQFVPDLVVVDYMNICCSSRLKQGQTNSYGYIKAISEELRGLAVEYNVALLTATQTNRNGFNNSDVELTDISESIGSTHVMDMIFALIRTEALDEMGQIEIKQLKNRYSDPAKEPTIQLGFDRQKMKVYDLDSKANVNNPLNYASSFPSPLSNPAKVVKPSEADDIPWKIESVDSAPKNDFSSFQF